MRKTNWFILVAAILFSVYSLAGEDIHEAAKKGDLPSIKKILETKPASITALDEEGESPLHHAILKGHRGAAEFLVQQLKDVNLYNRDRQTPLHYTAYKGEPELAALLLSKGADIEATDGRKFSPLQYAFFRNQRKVAEVLIDKGANIDAPGMFGNTYLFDCARRGNLEMVSFLLSKGADPNRAWFNGGTPLHETVMKNHLPVVKLLLEKGANHGAVDVQGNTPLHTAVFFGRKEMAELLTSAGADIHKKNAFGRTPMHRAAIAGYGAIVELLLKKGADAGTKDISGDTPITSAITYGNKNIARMLTGRTQPIPSAKPRPHVSPGQGEAVVWYLGQSGWAIKTKKYFLAFDNWRFGEMPDEPSLNNGWITSSEMTGRKVYVFISHAHYDHYDPSVLEWRKIMNDITYIFGWQPEKKAEGDKGDEYFTGNKETREIGGLKVTNLRCEDGGSAFLVEAGGLVLYHGGDYSGDVKKDMDFLAGLGKSIDLAFIESGSFHRETCEHTISKLCPRVMFPQHAFGTEIEYRQFADAAKKKFPGVTFVCVRNRGDGYHYKR